MHKIFLTFSLLIFCISSLFAQFVPKRHKLEVHAFRHQHKKEFLKEERSPFYQKEAALNKIKFYKPKKKYRVLATFTRTPDAQPFDMPTYSGITKEFVKYGTLSFELDKQKYELALYQNLKVIRIPGYKEYLFLPFNDETNDVSTYGGGRYIDYKISDITDGQLVLDFNKCYNPWCAYSEGYNCPVPPKENNLNIAIKAGEKNFKK